MAVASVAGLLGVLEFIFLNINGLTGPGTTATKRSDLPDALVAKYAETEISPVMWESSPYTAPVARDAASWIAASALVILGQVNHLSAIATGVGLPLLGIVTLTCAADKRDTANASTITDLVEPFMALEKAVSDMASTIVGAIACAAGADVVYNYTLAASLALLNTNMAWDSGGDIGADDKDKITAAYGGMNATISALGYILTISADL